MKTFAFVILLVLLFTSIDAEIPKPYAERPLQKSEDPLRAFVFNVGVTAGLAPEIINRVLAIFEGMIKKPESPAGGPALGGGNTPGGSNGNPVGTVPGGNDQPAGSRRHPRL